MAGTLAIVPRHVLGGPGYVAPSDKTTLAGIGLGGQGSQNITSLMQYPEVQVVAVCDVNRESGGYQSWNWTEGKEQRTAGREPARRAVEEFYAKTKGCGKYRGCRTYCDYRELLAKEKVDGVMVATPDHSHAVITMAALKLGKHVYCEKPLAYSVHEIRQVTETARKAGVATQLGNQGQASEEARLVREIIADGAIGPVHEVQVWSPARFWALPALRRPARPRRRRFPRASIGTCGLARPRAARIIRPIAPGRGGTGGTLAPACWATWDATSCRPCSRH